MQKEISYYDFKTDKEPAIIIYASELMNDIDPTEKIIYYVLKMFSMGKESAYPAIETMGRILGISEKTVRNKINGLVEKGLVWKKSRYDKKGRTSNLYITYDISSNLRSKEAQKKVLADNHEDKDKQNINNNSIENNTTTVEAKSQEKVNPIDENICKVREIVQEPLQDSEIKTILKVAKNDLEVIKAKYEIAKTTDNVKKMGAWLVTAIKENWQAGQDTATTTSNVPNRSNKAVSTYKANKNTYATYNNPNNRFNAFPQRDYTNKDYCNLEQVLLARSSGRELTEEEIQIASRGFRTV